MGRRGENIRKRQDGRWEARVVQGRPHGGKTNYKYLYGSSYQDVRRKKKAFLERRRPVGWDEILSPTENGLRDAPFRDVVSAWLACKKSEVKESTYSCYATMAEKHLLPALGALPVGEIDSRCLAGFLEKKKTSGRLRGGPLSDKTLSDMKTVLMQILRFAKKRGMIPAVPDCPAMPSRTPDASVLTMGEQKLVEARVMEEDTPFSLGVLLSLYGGVRIGEVCGLQWRDFDCQNGTISINKTVYRITDRGGQDGPRTKVVIGTPKTDCSVRTIPLPTPVFQYFMARRRDGDCYIVTGTARYMEPRVCLDRYKRLLRRAGVADHSFHTLRHTYATRCVESGVDVKSLSEIMGHSNVKITLQRYVHPSMDTKKQQVNKPPCFPAGGQIRGQAYREIA